MLTTWKITPQAKLGQCVWEREGERGSTHITIPPSMDIIWNYVQLLSFHRTHTEHGVFSHQITPSLSRSPPPPSLPLSLIPPSLPPSPHFTSSYIYIYICAYSYMYLTNSSYVCHIYIECHMIQGGISVQETLGSYVRRSIGDLTHLKYSTDPTTLHTYVCMHAWYLM
jgi:hypothetical protein